MCRACREWVGASFKPARLQKGLQENARFVDWLWDSGVRILWGGEGTFSKGLHRYVGIYTYTDLLYI